MDAFRYTPLVALLLLAQTARAQMPPLFSVDSGTSMIYEMNPYDGTVANSFGTPVPTHTPMASGAPSPGPEGLAYDGTHLYFVSGNASEVSSAGLSAADNRTIYRLDPSTGAVLGSVVIPAPASPTSDLDHAIDALASDDGTKLFANRPFDHTIFVIDLSTMTVSGSFTLTGVNSQGGMGFNPYDGYLYISEAAPSTTVHRVDPTTGTSAGSFSMPSSGLLGLDFVHNKAFLNQGPDIVEISPFDGAEYNRFPAPGTLLSALAGGPATDWTCRPNLLYSVDSQDSSISVIDPNTGTIEHRFLAPVPTYPPGAPPAYGGPEALSHDGAKLSYLSGDHPDATVALTVFKVDHCTGAILDAAMPPFPSVGSGVDPTIDALANGTYGGVDMLFALRPATNEVYHFDRSTGALAGTTTLSVSGIGGLGFSNARQTLFVSDFNASPNVLYEINPASGGVIASHTMPSSDILGVDLVGERLFVSYNKIPGEIQELDFSGSPVAAAFAAPDNQPSALAGPPSTAPSPPSGSLGTAPLFSVDSQTDRIYELDPYTGAVRRDFPTPVASHVPGGAGPDGLAFDGSTLYYTSGNASETGMGYTGLTNRTIFYIDPATGTVFDTMTLPAAGGPGDLDQAIDALASDGTFLYAHRPSDQEIFQINPTSKVYSRIPLSAVNSVGGMGYNVYDGYLYISDSTTDTVHRVDPSTGTSLATWSYAPDQGILGIDFVMNKMFVSFHGSPTEIIEVSPLSGMEINRFSAPGNFTAALAGPPGHATPCDPNLLYSVDSSESMISAIDPDTGVIQRRFLAPAASVPPGSPSTLGGPEGLAFDGSDLFYISGDHPVFANTIFRVETCSGGIVDMIAPSWPSAGPADPTVDALAYGEPGGSPTIFANRPATNEIFALDPNTGSLRGTITLPGTAIGGLGFSASRQTLFASNWNVSPSELYEIDPGSGSILATHTMTGSDVLGVDLVMDRLFAATDNGSGLIEELDYSGSVLNSFPAPDLMPSALAGPPGAGPPPPVFANVTFELNTLAIEASGLFDPSTDQPAVVGDFNGWSCNDPSCELQPTLGGDWEVTLPVGGHPGQDVHFGFVIDLDPARFGGTPTQAWESPYTLGGGDRTFVFTGSDVDLPAIPFADLVPGNVIPSGTAVDATFQVDMRGAPGFIPGTHDVFVNLGREMFWAMSQGVMQNQRFMLADPDGDGIYKGVFTLSGVGFSGIQYRYAFGTDPANPVGEEAGGSFDEIGQNRSAWIVPTSSGWPSAFDFPLDTFQPTGPLPVAPNPAALIAVDDTFSTPEDTPVELDVVANDIDPSGLGLSIDDVTEPATGAVLSDPGTGNILFTPTADFSGTVTFKYRVEDSQGQSDDATVTVTVTPVNDPPRASPDAAQTNKGTPVTIDPLANDTDPEGDALTVTSVTTPANGTAAVSGNRITYTPRAGFFGTDRFEYVASDGGATSRGAVTVTVLNVNLPPLAPAVSVSTPEDTPVSLDLLAGASDPDGDAVSLSGVTAPGNGTTTVGSDGTVTYAPAANFFGTDTFTYTVQDTDGEAATGTVTITVSPVNDPPVAVNDVRRAFPGASVTFDVLANDTDPDGDQVFLLTSSGGTLGNAFAAGGRIHYTPFEWATGTDVIFYTISDTRNATNGVRVTARLEIQIAAIPTDDDGVDESTENNAPGGGDGNGDGIPDSEQANVASLPSATTGQYVSVATETGGEIRGVSSSSQSPAPPEDPPPAGVDFPAGFLDFEITGGSGNTARTVHLFLETGLTANAYYKYGPTPDNPTPHWYNFIYDGQTGAVILGNVIILYFVDGERGDDDLTVNGVIVDPGAPAITPNKLPIAGADAGSVDEDNALTIDVLANDTDGDNDSLSILQVTQPVNGEVVVTNGQVQYTPNENFFGTDTFSYLVSDGNGGTTSATVTVTVNPINDAPLAVDDTFVTDEDTPINLTTLLLNDTDVEGDALALALVAAADEGLVVRNADGSITYTPPAEFSGTDSFTYTITDGTNQSIPGRVTVTVNSVNDAPVTAEDFATLEVGQTQVTIDVLANDSDVDSQTLTVSAVDDAAHGTVTILPDGTLLYEPGPTFQNADSFNYTVSDGDGGTSTGTVTISLGAAAPIAEGDEGLVDEDNPIVINVLDNDSDPNGDSLTVIAVSAPQNGTAVIDADGNVVYTPDADFFGTDTFTYDVSDGGIVTTATVTVTINPVNDAPRFEAGQDVFQSPAPGSQVFVGGAAFENPVDATESFFVDFGEAEDVEGDALTYKWVLSTDEAGEKPILESNTDETELTFLVSEIAEILDGAGATPGEGVTVYHRITASDGDLETTSQVSSFTIVRGYITSVDKEAIPEDFELHQNYPNPFNPVTRIRFGLPAAGPVQIHIYDSLGRRVAEVVDSTMPAGYHDIVFEAVSLPSGVYLYVMRAGDFTQTRSLVLLR